MQLRAYQAQAVEQIRDAYRAGNRAVLFVLPTGGGKTVTFAHIVAGALAKDKRTLVLAHRYELVEQIEAAVPADDRVTVAMVQTATRRLDKIEPPDFIVTDEAHHASAVSYRSIYEQFPDAHHLGVTATPARTDGAGLGDIFDAMVVGPTMRELIASGHLADYRVFAPPETIDLKGVRKRGGDYAKGDLASAVDTPRVTGDAINEYRRHCEGRRAIVFCVNVKHAQNVAAEFCAAGYPAWSVDGSMAREDRDTRIADFRHGAAPILTSCDLVGEGFDVPGIDAAILLRPTASVIVYLQQVGRALRPAPGKDRAIIIDCVGNCHTHGLPCDERAWSLTHTTERDKSEAPVKRCGECQALVPASVSICPECGATFPVSEASPTVSGDLVEIDKEARAEAMRQLAAMSYRAAVATIKGPADIKQVAAARGYKSAWSIRLAMERFELDPWQAAKALGYKPGIVFRLGLHERRSQ